jgi:hypothetical protein
MRVDVDISDLSGLVSHPATQAPSSLKEQVK